MSDIGFSGNVASSAINAEAIEQANQANIAAQKELNKQNRLAHSRANRKGRTQSFMDKKYATAMSNTAVSRKMTDMINAGLNPMALGGEAAQGASSAPVGHSSRSVANLGKADIKAKNTMNMTGGLLDVASGIVGIKNTQAQTSNLVANDAKIQSEADVQAANADFAKMQNAAVKDQLKKNPNLTNSALAASKLDAGGLVSSATSALSGAKALGSSVWNFGKSLYSKFKR